MERETRLELATVCLEGRSSSQLSYSRSIVVRMRRLELPHREAPDPKSVFKYFSIRFISLQNLSKDIYIVIVAKGYFSFLFYYFHIFPYFVVKSVVKNIKYMERNY